MTGGSWQKLAGEAIDDSLKLHIAKLFGVLMSDTGAFVPDSAIERFHSGLRKAVGAHDRLLKDLERLE